MASNDFFDPFAAYSATPQMSSMETKFSGKQIVVIFVIDSSVSMEGARIGAVNSALTEVVRESLRSIKANHNLDIKVAIMSFAGTVRWELNLTPLEEVDLPVIKVRPGVTLYGAAFHELSKVLRKDKFMTHTGKTAAPAIIFMTDGEPDPSDHYEDDLKELMENGWFRSASRFAILIGDAIQKEKARQAVSKFVNDPVRDVVAAEDSSTIIRQINLATQHTVAGEPDNSGAYTSETATQNPFGSDRTHSGAHGGASDASDPFANDGASSATPGGSAPFGGDATGSNPFGNDGASDADSGGSDPFGGDATGSGPFGNGGTSDADSGGSDPFGGDATGSNLFGNGGASDADSGGFDPFGGDATGSDPFGNGGTSDAGSGDSDPFSGDAAGLDPFDGVSDASDPFANDGVSSTDPGDSDPFLPKAPQTISLDTTPFTGFV